MDDQKRDSETLLTNRNANLLRQTYLFIYFQVKHFPKRFLPHIFYTISGIILFLVMGVILLTHFFRLKVETSVVSAAIETMMAPLPGLVNEITVKPGMIVKKGKPLIKIENLELERDMLLAKLSVNEAELNLAFLKKRYMNEQERLSIYKNIGSDRLSSTEARLAISKEQLSLNKSNLMRISELHKKHYISEADWEIAQVKYKNAKEQLKDSLAEKNLENNSLNALTKGLYFTGNKIEGSQNDLLAEIANAEDKLIINKNKLHIYEYLLSKLTLLAPFDGKIRQIYKSVGNTTDSVKPLLLIEQNSVEKQVMAYLTQNEITQIQLGGKVRVYIPALHAVFKGYITHIDRTEGFVDEVNAQYRWRDLQVDHSAIATINIDKIDQIRFSTNVDAGMPAIVYFSRKFNFL